MIPNDDQREVVCACRQYRVITCEAGAGTGKTSLIKMVAIDNPDRQILYLCYTKSVQVQAEQTMPSNVTSLTHHACAGKALTISKRFGQKAYQELMPSVIKRRLNLPSFKEAIIVKRTVTNYCQSADRFITGCHIPPEAIIGVPVKARNTFKDDVLGWSNQTWNWMQDKRDKEVGMDYHYLKVWQIEGAPLPRTFGLIAVDECQDFNGVQIDATERQNVPTLWTGDSDQGIFAWRGAINALDVIRNGADDRYSKHLSIRQSYRFGQSIADLANRIRRLKPTPRPQLIGNSDITTEITTGVPEEPYTMLFHTNASLLIEAALLAKHNKGIHIVKGLTEAINLLESVYHTYKGDLHLVHHPVITMLGSWGAVVEATEFSADIKRSVDMVQRGSWMVPELLDTLRKIPQVPERYADIVLSTIHKAKGREWDRVLCYPDGEELLSFGKDGKRIINQDYVNLRYVQVTRAKQVLSIDSVIQGIDTTLEIVGKSDGRKTYSTATDS